MQCCFLFCYATNENRPTGWTIILSIEYFTVAHWIFCFLFFFNIALNYTASVFHQVLKRSEGWSIQSHYDSISLLNRNKVHLWPTSARTVVSPGLTRLCSRMLPLRLGLIRRGMMGFAYWALVFSQYSRFTSIPPVQAAGVDQKKKKCMSLLFTH